MINKKEGIVIALLIITCLNSFGQQDSIVRKDYRRFGFGLQIMGPATISLEADYFIIRQLNIELGTGFEGSYGGVNGCWRGKQYKTRWSPYLGVQYFRYDQYTLMGGGGSNAHGIYCPIGVQYISKNGFKFGIEVAQQFFLNDDTWSIYGPTNYGKIYSHPLSGAIKISGGLEVFVGLVALILHGSQ